MASHPASRTEILGATAVALVVTGAWFLLTMWAEAVGIARNDDWSYLENAFRFADTGVFAVGGWVQMMLIGQLILAAPVIAVFGPSVGALQGVVAALGVILLTSAYAILRNFLSPIWAAASTATLAFSALFGLLSVSFMTDIPAAAFQLLAIAFGYRALRASKIAWPKLLLATAFGLMAVSIREYAVAALVAIWVTAGRSARMSRSYRGFAAWTVAMGVIVGLMLLWRSGQVTVTDSPLGLNPIGLRYLAWWPLTAGLLLLPAAVAGNPVRVARRAWSSSRLLTVVALLGATGAMAHTRLGFLGNYLSLSGGYAEVARGIPTPVLPIWWSTLLTAAAVYGGYLLALLLVGAICKWWEGRRARLSAGPSSVSLGLAFVVVTALVYAIVPVLADVALFDRYFVAALPIAAGLVVWWLRREDLMWQVPLVAVSGVIAAVAVTSVVLVAATSARDAARWQIADRAAEQLGVAAGNIDGGFDYYSFNTNGGARPEGVRWTWWTARLGDRAVCATVTYGDVGSSDSAAGPDPTAEPLLERTVSSPLARDQLLLVYPGPDSC